MDPEALGFASVELRRVSTSSAPGCSPLQPEPCPLPWTAVSHRLEPVSEASPSTWPKAGARPDHYNFQALPVGPVPVRTLLPKCDGGSQCPQTRCCSDPCPQAAPQGFSALGPDLALSVLSLLLRASLTLPRVPSISAPLPTAPSLGPLTHISARPAPESVPEPSGRPLWVSRARVPLGSSCACRQHRPAWLWSRLKSLFSLSSRFLFAWFCFRSHSCCA